MDKKIEFLTFNEYYEIINSRHMNHSSKAYNHDINVHNNGLKEIDDYKRIVKRFTTGNLDFEVREIEIDNHKFDYAKRDENGEIARDANGLAIKLTKEEKEKLIQPRYSYEYMVVDVKDNLIVAKTQDDWGCLLITVATEYHGLGIGDVLFKEHNKKYPYRESGGTTPQGKSLVYRYYQNKISDFLMSGGYSKSYRNGEISKEKIKEILKSANVNKKLIQQENEKFKDSSIHIETFMETKKRKIREYLEKDLNMHDSSDLLLHIDSNFAILYNKKAFDNVRNDDFEEYFIEKGLVGLVYIGGVYESDAIPKLFSLHGKNEKIKQLMVEIGMNIFVDEPVRIHDVDLELLNDNVLNNAEKVSKIEDFTVYTLKQKTIKNLETFGIMESLYRKENDPYSEKWHMIHEKIDGLAKDINERIKEKEEMKESNKRKNKRK